MQELQKTAQNKILPQFFVYYSSVEKLSGLEQNKISCEKSDNLKEAESERVEGIKKIELA